jgi:hypothetical protein
MANMLLVIGAVLVGLGVLLNYAPQSLAWFGHLPGDIRYQSEHSLIVIPLTSMVIVSLVLSVILRLLRS